MQNEVPEVCGVNSVPDLEIIGCPKEEGNREDEPLPCSARTVSNN